MHQGTFTPKPDLPDEKGFQSRIFKSSVQMIISQNDAKINATRVVPQDHRSNSIHNEGLSLLYGAEVICVRRLEAHS